MLRDARQARKTLALHGAKVSTEEVELTHAAKRLQKAQGTGFRHCRTLFNTFHLRAKQEFSGSELVTGQEDHSDIILI